MSPDYKKTCIGCGELLPADCYYSDPRTTDRLKNKCKMCLKKDRDTPELFLKRREYFKNKRLNETKEKRAKGQLKEYKPYIKKEKIEVIKLWRADLQKKLEYSIFN